MCYGFVGPIASNMLKSSDDEHAYYHVLRVAIIAFMKGSAPSIAVEIARAIHSRATFAQTSKKPIATANPKRPQLHRP